MRASGERAATGWEPEPQFGGCQKDINSPSPAVGELAEARISGLNKSDLHVFLDTAGGHSSWKQLNCQGEATPEVAVMFWKAGANQLCSVCLPQGELSLEWNDVACRFILETFWERRFLSVPRVVWRRRHFSSFSEELFCSISLSGARIQCAVLFPKETKML